MHDPIVKSECAMPPVKHTQHLRLSVGAAAGRIVVVSGRSHATQLVLSREVLRQLSERSNELLADVDEDLAGGNGAVGLKADQDLGHIGVSDYTFD